ncbi:MAG TPA: bacteriohemerythrin [Rhodocyclaceae bacterium]
MISKDGLSRYAFGIEEIDAQHRALFEFIGKLDAAIPTADSWVVVQQTLNDLNFWARVHFAVEESLMRLMGFPEAEAHNAMHADFMETIARLKKQSLRKDIARDTSRFLNDWLRHHIDVEDRKYAEHFLMRCKPRSAAVS